MPLKKLDEYKGRVLDRAAMLDLSEKAELTNVLMSVVFSLRMDESYTKEDAVKSLLDVITNRLDFEFQTGSDDVAWKAFHEIDRLSPIVTGKQRT